MSKTFRGWKIDEPLLLPLMVGDFVAEDHLARFVLNLVRDDIDLAEITGGCGSERGQPPFHRYGPPGTASMPPSNRRVNSPPKVAVVPDLNQSHRNGSRIMHRRPPCPSYAQRRERVETNFAKLRRQ